jgi:hypothetical protein
MRSSKRGDHNTGACFAWTARQEVFLRGSKEFRLNQ